MTPDLPLKKRYSKTVMVIVMSFSSIWCLRVKGVDVVWINLAFFGMACNLNLHSFLPFSFLALYSPSSNLFPHLFFWQPFPHLLTQHLQILIFIRNHHKNSLIDLKNCKSEETM